MKREISPAMAAAVIAVLVVLVGGFLWLRAGGVVHTDEKPPGMPAEAAASLQKLSGPGGQTAPKGGGAPPIAGGYIPQPKGP